MQFSPFSIMEQKKIQEVGNFPKNNSKTKFNLECKGAYAHKHFLPASTNEQFREWSKNFWRNYKFVAFFLFVSFFLLIPIESMYILNIFAKQCMFAIDLQKVRYVAYRIRSVTSTVHSWTFFRRTHSNVDFRADSFQSYFSYLIHYSYFFAEKR